MSASPAMLSGYTPPHVDYQPAGAGDLALHSKVQKESSERAPATRVTLSSEALAAFQAHAQK